MKLKTLLKYIFSIVILSMIFTSCGNNIKDSKSVEEEHEESKNEEVSLTEEQFKNAAIEFGKVSQKQISGTFKVNGVLDVPPQQQISISVPMGGFLKKTDLLQGMKVNKGQLLGVIENSEYVQMQQDYLEAKSELEFANSDFKRQQELAKENVNSQKTVQQAKSTYNSLIARVNSLKEKIKVSGINLSAVEKGNIQSTMSIYSPITGFVTQVNANIGKFVNPTDVLFEIVDTEHLHAELTVFEKDVPKLKIGQKVRFTLANENTERTAKIYLIGREIGEDRTVRVHSHIDKEDLQLLPGMYLRAIIETGAGEVNALPNDAIVDFQGSKYIFIKSEEVHKEEIKKEEKEEVHEEEAFHFKMIPIQINNSDEGFTEVILPADFDQLKTEIVLKGAYDLLSKMKNSEEGHGH